VAVVAVVAVVVANTIIGEARVTDPIHVLYVIVATLALEDIDCNM